MATKPNLATYINQVRGKYIDVDKVFGAQCWDQWAHYAQWLGVPLSSCYTRAGGAKPHGGWACNVYHNARAAGLEKWFQILPASAKPRAGDVAFWEYGSAFYPKSHVASVLSVPRAGMLRCLTQNPGAVQVTDLITKGLIGYLRPKSLATTGVNSKKTSPKGGIEVRTYHRKDKDARAKGRTLKPGQGLYLNTKSGGLSNYANIVGGIGYYIITGHLYAEGEPGDTLDMRLIWRHENKGARSDSAHYTETITLDEDGRAKASRTFQREVPRGYSVRLQVLAPKANKGRTKVTLLDSDATLFID